MPGIIATRQTRGVRSKCSAIWCTARTMTGSRGFGSCSRTPSLADSRRSIVEGGMAKYGQHAPRPLLALFAAKRRLSLASLRELKITDAMLMRTAQHPEFGEVTLAQLLACWLTHDLAHIAQIARVLVRRQ